MSQTIDVTGLPEVDVEAIKQFVANMKKQHIRSRDATPDQLTAEEWMNRFNAWVQSLPPCHVVLDDSRESIYAGRGE